MASDREERDAPLVERAVEIVAEGAVLRGILSLPPGANGIVFIISSDPDTSRTVSRSGRLVRALLKMQIGVLAVSLMTETETSGRPMVSVGPLNERIELATSWLSEQPETGQLPVGYYASETAAPAAIQASMASRQVRAIVSRGGRLDLAFNTLPEVKAPTLVLAEQEDDEAIAMGQSAYNMLGGERKFVIVQGSPDRPGGAVEVSEEVVGLAVDWFRQHLPSA